MIVDAFFGVVDSVFWMGDYERVFICNFLDLESGNCLVTFEFKEPSFNEPQWYILKYPLSYFSIPLLKVICGYPKVSSQTPVSYAFQYIFGFLLLVCLYINAKWNIYERFYPLQGR